MERYDKVANLIKELSAEFLERQSDSTSLITVTGTNTSPDLRQATIFITVFPTEKEEKALNFVKRSLGELREYLKKKMEIKTIPFLNAEIDQGEKNRQKIDELLRDK